MAMRYVLTVKVFPEIPILRERTGTKLGIKKCGAQPSNNIWEKSI